MKIRKIKKEIKQIVKNAIKVLYSHYYRFCDDCEFDGVNHEIRVSRLWNKKAVKRLYAYEEFNDYLYTLFKKLLPSNDFEFVGAYDLDTDFDVLDLTFQRPIK